MSALICISLTLIALTSGHSYNATNYTEQQNVTAHPHFNFSAFQHFELDFSPIIKIERKWYDGWREIGRDASGGKSRGYHVVKIGDELRISVARLPLGYDAGFQACSFFSNETTRENEFCLIQDYRTGMSGLLAGEQFNCMADGLNALDGWRVERGNPFNNTFKNYVNFRAFLYKSNVTLEEPANIFLACNVSICHTGNTTDANCWRGCASGISKRSLDRPHHAPDLSRDSTLIPLRVVGREECDLAPPTPHGATRCDAEFRVGSTCRHECGPGFVNVGSKRQTCVEVELESFGPIYTKAATEWRPELPPSCQDVDECKGSPCGPNLDCVNTIGSFLCLCPKGSIKDGGACLRTTSFRGSFNAKAFAVGSGAALGGSGRYRQMEAFVRKELTGIFGYAFKTTVSVKILGFVRSGDVVEVQFKVNVASRQKLDTDEERLEASLKEAIIVRGNDADFDLNHLRIWEVDGRSESDVLEEEEPKHKHCNKLSLLTVLAFCSFLLVIVSLIFYRIRVKRRNEKADFLLNESG